MLSSRPQPSVCPSGPASASAAGLVLAIGLLLFAPLLAPSACADARARASASAGPRSPGQNRQNHSKEGQILRIFEKARVYVVTNDDTDLGDLLLAGANHRERRILTPEQWQEMPDGIRRYVSVVFLINRELLPIYSRIPEKCPAERDELFTEVSRLGYENGISYQVVLSAPDSAWLRQAISDFRRLAGPPRGPQRRNVRSLAVVPIGPDAARAAAPLLEAPDDGPTPRAHLLPAARYARSAPRIAEMDEVFLVDRSAASELMLIGIPGIEEAIATRGSADTTIWRQRKQNGRWRVYISAPQADHLTQALERFPDPLAAPDTQTVIHTARDLRSVRRVAVVGVKSGQGGAELARQLASRVATNLRGLEAFEVLERSGLSEVLGEAALGQAGITRAADRSRVRQLAAADALLLVEVTGINGRTGYDVTHKRLTARLGPPPKRPVEPSRLKIAISLPGKENDPLARVLTDTLLKGAVGTKSDREYKQALNHYNESTLPRWQRQVEEYEQEKRRRSVSWEQRVTARHEATVSGSLRLVDLTDGLVLWETAFSATEREEYPAATRIVSSQGEESEPGKEDIPESGDSAPESLIARAAESALAESMSDLRSTALLPTIAATDLTTAGTTPTRASGRILDIDGSLILIGLGAADGVRLDDTLTVTLPTGGLARLVVTRVRPRTCDATFEKGVTLTQKANLKVGLIAARETGVASERPLPTVPSEGKPTGDAASRAGTGKEENP